MPITNLVVIACSALLALSTSAFATISVAPGEYELPALVGKGRDGLSARFNLNTRSRLDILLQGEQASVLEKRMKKLYGGVIRIRVSQRIFGAHGKAELLEFRPLSKEERISIQVGNDLKAIPLEK